MHDATAAIPGEMTLVHGFGLAAAALPLFIWLYLLFARHWFWRTDRNLAPVSVHEPPPCRVTAVIPARNEAGVVASTIRSLVSQQFSGSIYIVLVDDASEDGTAEAALAAADSCGTQAQLQVVEGSPLPPGWTGKMWAVSQGVQHALATAPDFLLFTDADISHAPGSLATLVSLANGGPYDLVSFMVKLESRSFAERWLIPAFVFFFLMLYPPAAIADPGNKLAGAAGGCMLVRPSRLVQAGGIDAIRGEIIDDCALARLIKQAGGRVWLGLTPDTISTRSYKTLGEIECMVSRTAFNQLNHSVVLLAATLFGLAITYIVPVALAVSGRFPYFLLGLAAWCCMSAAYMPMLRFYGQNRMMAFTLPAIALFYAAATLHSAVNYWRGAGGVWKGRPQDVPKEP